MLKSPMELKKIGRDSLKGNWQTAAVVSFFASFVALAVNLIQSMYLPDFSGMETYEQMERALLMVPQGVWVALLLLGLLNFFVTPMLDLGCRHYFVSRLKGQELGYKGLFSRARCFGKALWLEILTGLKVFAWALLLIVPGIIAAFRYSQAAYFLAEDPELKASEAIEKSKAVMVDKKMYYFMLGISFLGLQVIAIFAQTLLVMMSPILGLVAGLAMSLALATYMNATFAAFYQSLTGEEPTPPEADERAA